MKPIILLLTLVSLIISGSESFGQNLEFSTIDFPNDVIEPRVTAINDRGQIVGDYFDADGETRGFLMEGGQFSTIDFPDFVSLSTMAAINDNGQIVGGYTNAGGPPAGHAFLLDAGQFHNIDFPDTNHTFVRNINDQRQIVGAYLDGGILRGFLLNQDQFRTIDFPDADGTDIVAINNSGKMAGIYDVLARGPVDPDVILILRSTAHGFVLDGEQFSLIDFPDASETFTTALNDQGQVVGSYLDLNGVRHGFLLSAGHFHTVGFPNALQTFITAINNNGQIAGYADDANGMRQNFVADVQSITAVHPREKRATTWGQVKVE